MAVIPASHTPLVLARIAAGVRRHRWSMSSMGRGALMTMAGHITSLARPVAIAWFARSYGEAALGTFLLLWTCIELGARLSTLGLDRGLQRWSDARRAAAAMAGIAIAAASGLVVAYVLARVLPYIASLDAAVMAAARPLLLIGIPLAAASNVALRAPRGETQIRFVVLARSVTEPMAFLLAGLVASSYSTGSVGLPVALLISIIAGSAVAAVSVVRAFGVRTTAAALVQPRSWPVRELVTSSLPLGVADLLLTVQAKIDLVAVTLATLSPRQIAAYAIAAEVASVFLAIRSGFDQVVAPFAAEARRDRASLARTLATATRWSLAVALVVGLAVVTAPGQWLVWFGGADTAAPILLVMLLGRAVELVTTPAASMLAMVGDPRLPLLSAAAGLSIAILGQIVSVAAHLDSAHIALASSLGVIVSSMLAWHWVQRYADRPGRMLGTAAVALPVS